MGIVVRLPFVSPKRQPSHLRRSGRDTTAALVSTYDGLRAFGAQAVILQQPWYLPIICSSIWCSILLLTVLLREAFTLLLFPTTATIMTFKVEKGFRKPIITSITRHSQRFGQWKQGHSSLQLCSPNDQTTSSPSTFLWQ